MGLVRTHPRLRGADRWQKIRKSGGISFSPADLGVVSAWLRVPLATVTGSGISSLPDVLNVNPAVQATDLARPPRVTSANGLLVAQGVDDRMQWPANAANNQLVTWGFAAHVLLDDLIATKSLVRYGPGGSAFPVATDSHRVSITSSESINLSVATDATGLQVRSATSPVSMLNGTTYVFVTVECDFAAATEALKVTMTFDGGAPVLVTFADITGTPGAMPTALQGQPGGSDISVLNTRTASNQNPFIGKTGPNIYILGSKMPAATVGLLTPAARFSLGSFERPT